MSRNPMSYNERVKLVTRVEDVQARLKAINAEATMQARTSNPHSYLVTQQLLNEEDALLRELADLRDQLHKGRPVVVDQLTREIERFIQDETPKHALPPGETRSSIEAAAQMAWGRESKWPAILKDHDAWENAYRKLLGVLAEVRRHAFGKEKDSDLVNRIGKQVRQIKSDLGILPSLLETMKEAING